MVRRSRWLGEVAGCRWSGREQRGGGSLVEEVIPAVLMPQQWHRWRVPAGWSMALLLLGCGANHIVVVGQWTNGAWTSTGLCCDIDHARTQFVNSHEPTSDACHLTCDTNHCGEGQLDADTLICTCFHRDTPRCGSPCRYQNDGDCDELPGVDGMGALCAPGTDVQDCEEPDTPLTPTRYPASSFGRAAFGCVDASGARSWFVFAAEAGTTYVIEAHGLAGENGLADTLLSLYDQRSPSLQLLAQNDDAPDRGGTSQELDSYIEWTCPADGDYLVAVSGFLRSDGCFNLMISLASAEITEEAEYDEVAEDAPPVSGDPCHGGSTLTRSGGEIVFTANQRQQECSWSIVCPQSTCPDPTACTRPIVSIDFSEFQLSGASGNEVILLDGQSPRPVPGPDGTPIAPLTGSLPDLYATGGATFSSTVSSLTVRFESGNRSPELGSHLAGSHDHFTASYMCSRQPVQPVTNSRNDWLLLLLLSIVVSIGLNLVLIRRRRARILVAAAAAGRAPLVPAIEATPVDIETSHNPVASPTLVTVSSIASTADAAGLPPTPSLRSGSSMTGRWECPVCHRENPAYRTRCEGCPGPATQPAAGFTNAAGTAAGADVPIVVQSSAVLGVATETLNSLLRACSLEAFETSLQELGVVESNDLRTVSDERLNSLGMKPVEVERLRRRLQ